MNGKKLKRLRMKAGLGQRELGERIGVTQAAISQLENGWRSCRPDTTRALARALSVPEKELAGRPPMLLTLMRNCKGLSRRQLSALNAMALEFQQEQIQKTS